MLRYAEVFSDIWVKPFEKEIGPKIGHFYNARQVAIIFGRLGLPGSGADEGKTPHGSGIGQ